MDNAAMHLQLLDLDGSVSPQVAVRGAAPWTSVSTLDLRDLGPALRLWSRRRAIGEARRRLAAAGDPAGPRVTLIGSGDYHHLAVLLMERLREPVTVVHFDNHPDWVRLAPRWHCGSWVNEALRLEAVSRIVTIGPCSDDLVRPGIKGGNLAALAEGRIVLFPWWHPPSRVWRRIADGPGHRYENGHLVWRNLADADLDEGIAAILGAIPTETVWFTIDKDVLPENEVVTNWDQGQMPLAALTRIIAAIGADRRVAGADICGEYAAPNFSNILKRMEIRMDQPRRGRVAEDQLKRNEAVNRTLLAAIEQVARPC